MADSIGERVTLAECDLGGSLLPRVTGWCCDFDQFYQPVKKNVLFAIQEKAGFKMTTNWNREKNWKLMYLRSEKLARARQLGIEYPRVQNLTQAFASEIADDEHQCPITLETRRRGA